MKKTRILAIVCALMLALTSLGIAEAFETIEFPDAMPAAPTQAEADYYAYDNMDEHYDITLFTYNYGESVPDNDPIKAWMEEKYNVTITLETVNSADVETYISTAFAGGDTPDVFCVGSEYKDLFFTLAEQGLLSDAKVMYTYMPQTAKFVTKTLIQYSTMADGTIPFTTKYAIQDGDIWNMAIRKDWLDALGMEVPTTLDELFDYAVAVTTKDPDGNGVDDTYFALGAGGGAGLGMLEAFATAFGNPNYSVGEDGKLVAPMLDGTRKQAIEYIAKLYAAGVLSPDWYSIEWEAAKAYTLNDKIGMVRYPASNLYGEYFSVNNDPEKCTNWYFPEVYPSETGKGGAGGNAGVLMAIPTANVEGNDGKLMRICHILDAMCYGGEAYFETVQGGGLEVHASLGYTADVREYKEDGRSTCYVDPSHPGYTVYGSDNLTLAPWQNFGYTLKWQDDYAGTPDMEARVNAIVAANANVSKMDRWENTALLYTVPSDINSTLKEYVAAQEYKFIVGDRSMDEWDAYVDEWKAQGGAEIIKTVAEQLGAELPDGI